MRVHIPESPIHSIGPIMRASPLPPPLPVALSGASPTTRLLYAWLKPQGVVDYSAQQLADLLHITKKSALAARSELATLELLEQVSPGNSRSAGRYFVS